MATLKNLIKNFKSLTELLDENPSLLNNIHIVHYSCTLLIFDEEEKKLVISKKPFAVTTTFHLCFESQIEAYLCEEYKVVKFIKPVRILNNGSQIL